MTFNNAEVIGTQLGNAVEACWQARAAIRGTILSDLTAIKRNNEGEFGSKVSDSQLDAKLILDGAYRSYLGTLLTPVLKNLLVLAGYDGDLDPAQNWPKIYKYLHEQDVTFLPRAPAYATLPGSATTSGKGSSDAMVGDSTLVQLTVDRYGNSLDLGRGAVNWTAEVKGQVNKGAQKFSEVIEVRSNDSESIFDEGAPARRPVQFNVTIPNSPVIVPDGDFKIGNAAVAAGSMTATGLGGWRDDSGIAGNYALLTSPVYRASSREIAQGGSTVNPLSLQFEGNTTLYRKLTYSFERGRPYLPVAAINTKDSCDRTATISLGRQTMITFNMNGESGDTWFLKYGTLDERLYFDNFLPIDGSDLKISIAVTQGAGSNTGKPVFDCVDALPGIALNGRWVWWIPGQTAHTLEDKWTWTDGAPATNGKYATILAEWAQVYVPTRANATEITASGGRTFTFANSSPPTITLSSGDLTSDGYQGKMNVTVAGSSSNDGTYLAASVSATVITLDASESLSAEGPVSSTTTLNAAPTQADP